jgi:hypothetical protein
MAVRFTKRVAALCAAAVVALAASAHAATIATYQAQPTSTAVPEFLFGGSPKALSSGPGAFSNSDGNLPVPLQTAPGLQFNTPFTVLGVPGSTVNGDGTTDFYDCSLILSGFAVSAPATNTFGVLTQPLGPGSFTVLSSNIAGGNVPLLVGNVSDAVITGIVGSTTGATLSATVTYTGGAIFAASGLFNPGNFSWSFTGIDLPLAISGDGYLRSFQANATGLFDATIPEPTTAGVFALALLAGLSRRRA